MNVAEHYDFTPDPKIAAWVSLIGTAGLIYGTRLSAIRLRIKMEREEARQRKTSTEAPDMGNVEILHPTHPAQGEPG